MKRIFVSGKKSEVIHLISTIAGMVGMVPAYGLPGLNAAVRIQRQPELKLAVKNCLNKQYYTRRPLFYPGPGVWPLMHGISALPQVYNYKSLE